VTLDLAKHVIGPGQGEALEWTGPVAGKVSIMIDPVKTGNTALCVLVQTLDPGVAIPVHHHEKAEQVLFVLSGHGKVSLAGREVDVGPGTTVHVPKGIAHGVANTSEEPMSLLETTSPPGFQELFRKLAKLSEPEPEDIARIGAQHDIVVHSGDDT
jgi:mannose-6-phosphate isomerase-like protein (cupin superfamily)